jgi:hypothetical protein
MAIAHIEGNDAQAFGPQPSLAVTTAGAGTLPSGTAVVGVVVADDIGSGTFASILDDKLNSYPIIATVTNNSRRASIFALGNITNGPKTITVTYASNDGNVQIAFDAYSGCLANSNPVDNSGASFALQVVPTPGTGADGVTSGSVTTVTNGCLIWGAGVHMAAQSAVLSAGTGETSRQSGNLGLLTEDKAQVTAGTIASTFTSSANDASAAGLVALAPAGGGGGGSGLVLRLPRRIFVRR